MRIDKDSKQLAFDNMQSRPIKGTTDWQKYGVVLDVPQDATGVFSGVLLGGTGQVWISNPKFEVVGAAVQTTGGNTASAMSGRTLEPQFRQLSFQVKSNERIAIARPAMHIPM